MSRPLKEPNLNKSYKNRAEGKFAELARSKGWSLMKRGYPDFFCFKGDDIMLVEVKPDINHRLSKSQVMVMNFLKSKGVKCYKWSPDKDWLTAGHSLNGDVGVDKYQMDITP